MSYANAPIVLNSRDLTSGQYNNAQFNAVGQNIIQGDIKEIAVSEVNFPYDIPNVQAGYNYFTLVNGGGPSLNIIVPPGFYTGPELETAINNIILAVGSDADPPYDAGELPTIAYIDSSNTFRFIAPTVDVGPPDNVWLIESPYTFPAAGSQSNGLGKDLLSIMGFSISQNGDNSVDADPVQGKKTFSGGSAPLIFTQYIDICSPQLCKFQYFRDGSTTNLARRADVICRLFVDNNISLRQDAAEGTRPFVINRQYYNARIMRWSVDNSVGTIDIQLYDDCGVPLTTTWQPRPYQITFNCYEKTQQEHGEREEEHAGPTRYAAYQEKNVSKAWANLRKQ